MPRHAKTDLNSYSVIASPIGSIALLAGGRGLRAVFICSDAEELRRSLEESYPGLAEASNALHEKARTQIEEYFGGRRTGFTLDLDLSTLSPFRRRALHALSRVPFGEFVSYGELALRLDPPSAARAIGGAMACNPLPLILPCHRVLGKNGSLTGYSGGEGVATKAWLLDFEQRMKTKLQNGAQHYMR